MTRTTVGKGGSFASRFDPEKYERSGRPGMTGTGDVDTAAMARDMAMAAADDSWMSKPIGYYGKDSLWNRYAVDKQKKKAKKKGEYEYKDNASGALEKLYDLGYGYDSAIQRATAAGIKKIDSLNDVDAIVGYEESKFGSKDKDKDKKPYVTPEGPENIHRKAYDSGKKKSPVDEARERVQRFQSRHYGNYFDSDKDLKKQGIEGYKENPFSY